MDSTDPEIEALLSEARALIAEDEAGRDDHTDAQDAAGSAKMETTDVAGHQHGCDSEWGEMDSLLASDGEADEADEADDESGARSDAAVDRIQLQLNETSGRAAEGIKLAVDTIGVVRRTHTCRSHAIAQILPTDC